MMRPDATTVRIIPFTSDTFSGVAGLPWPERHGAAFILNFRRVEQSVPGNKSHLLQEQETGEHVRSRQERAGHDRRAEAVS